MTHWLTTLPQDMPIERMVLVAKMRWRIECDGQKLTQNLGLGDDGGRGRRGFQHHASLAFAADGFLVAQRLRYPEHAGQRPIAHHAIAAGYCRSPAQAAVNVPWLPARKRKATLATPQDQGPSGGVRHASWNAARRSSLAARKSFGVRSIRVLFEARDIWSATLKCAPLPPQCGGTVTR